MDLESEIINLYSKRQVERILRWTGSDTGRFELLMNLFLHGDQNSSKRAAWVIGHCCERYPELARPWLRKMMKKIQDTSASGAHQRCVMRVLQYAEIPKSLRGTAARICFQFLSDSKAEIAPQVFAMTVLSNIAQEEPYILKELRIRVRQMLPYGTPAFRSRAKMIFRDLHLPEETRLPEIAAEEKLLHAWLMKKK